MDRPLLRCHVQVCCTARGGEGGGESFLMLLNMVGNGWAMAKPALMCSGPDSFTEFSRSSCCSLPGCHGFSHMSCVHAPAICMVVVEAPFGTS